MCENFEEQLKSIVKNPDNYTKMYDAFKIIFDISNVEIWKYNATTKKLSLLDDNQINMLTEAGITKQVLVTKSPMFTNHVISEKKYDAQIDNINSYKIKSMLVVPILYNDTMIGLIRLYRNIDNKQNFSSKDITNVKLLMPILTKLVLNKELLIDDVLTLSVNHDTKVKVKPNKASTKTPIKVNNTQPLQEKQLEVEKKEFEGHKQQLEREKKEFESHKQQLEREKKEFESHKQQLEKEKKEFEGHKQQLEREKKELKNEIKKNYSQLEDAKKSIKILTDKVNLHATKDGELQERVVTLKKDKSKLSTQFDTLKRNYDFLEKVSSEKESTSELDSILSKIYTLQNENENFMTLLKLTLFVDDFNEIPKSVEESIKNTKIINHILDTCSFSYDNKKDESYIIETFLKKIQSYCQPVLQKKNIELKLSLNQNIPKSLVFYEKVVNSIISRSIIKVQNSLQPNDIINLKVNFEEKQLFIELNFHIEEEKKVMKFFKADKDILNNPDDIFTKLNNKLLKTINGTIHTTNEDGNYSFILKIPTVVIKL